MVIARTEIPATDWANASEEKSAAIARNHPFMVIDIENKNRRKALESCQNAEKQETKAHSQELTLEAYK